MTAAWRRQIGPESGAAQLARVLVVPAELMVPLIRLVRGHRGVTLMPSAMGQVNAVAAGVIVGAVRRAGVLRSTVNDGRPRPVWQRALVLVALIHGLVSPFVAARSSRVVLPGRSPLWGYPLQGLLTVPMSLAMATALITVSRRARDEHRRSLTTHSEPGAGSASR